MLQYLCNFEQTLFTGVTTSRFNQLSFILTRIDFVSVLSKTFFLHWRHKILLTLKICLYISII